VNVKTYNKHLILFFDIFSTSYYEDYIIINKCFILCLCFYRKDSFQIHVAENYVVYVIIEYKRNIIKQFHLLNGSPQLNKTL